MEFFWGMKEILKDLGINDGTTSGNEYLSGYVRRDGGPTFSELANAISNKFNIDVLDIDEENTLFELHEKAVISEKNAN